MQIFTYSALTQSTVLNQIQSAVDFYASQISKIYSAVPTGYTYESINPTAIKGSIQISTSPLTTYYTSLSQLLVLTGSYLSSVDPNVVFGSLTSTVSISCACKKIKTIIFNL